MFLIGFVLLGKMSVGGKPGTSLGILVFGWLEVQKQLISLEIIGLGWLEVQKQIISIEMTVIFGPSVDT